jgi:hypothetical protein
MQITARLFGRTRPSTTNQEKVNLALGSIIERCVKKAMRRREKRRWTTEPLGGAKSVSTEVISKSHDHRNLLSLARGEDPSSF